MGSKGFIKGYQLASAQSLASDFESSAIDVKTVDNVCFLIETSSVSDNTGTFAVQVKIKKDDNNESGWATLSLDTTPTLANADDQFFINVNQITPCQIRIKFTAAGGTPDGTCDIWVSGKQV